MFNLVYFNQIWKDSQIFSVLPSLIITTLIIFLFSFYYWIQTRKKKGDDFPRGFLLLIDIILQNLEKIVKALLGKKYVKLTPYFFYLLTYINLGNFLSLVLGIASPFSFLTVTLSLGLVTFLGIYYFGFVFQGWKFLKNYLNPLQLISDLASWISLSFRLFGNVLAGFFVLSLAYGVLTGSMLGQQLKWFNILSIFFAPLHFYFDIFSGFLHSFIFTLLTIVYWSLSKPLVAQDTY